MPKGKKVGRVTKGQSYKRRGRNTTSAPARNPDSGGRAPSGNVRRVSRKRSY